jgi:hypothetical protein
VRVNVNRARKTCEVAFYNIDVDTPGTGTGSRVVEMIRGFCEEQAFTLWLLDVTNLGFWLHPDRAWARDSGLGGEEGPTFRYDPQGATTPSAGSTTHVSDVSA